MCIEFIQVRLRYSVNVIRWRKGGVMTGLNGERTSMDVLHWRRLLTEHNSGVIGLLCCFLCLFVFVVVLLYDFNMFVVVIFQYNETAHNIVMSVCRFTLVYLLLKFFLSLQFLMINPQLTVKRLNLIIAFVVNIINIVDFLFCFFFAF